MSNPTLIVVYNTALANTRMAGAVTGYFDTVEQAQQFAENKKEWQVGFTYKKRVIGESMFKHEVWH